MSADVELDNVSIRFGDFTAVKDASLKINGGEFFSHPRAVRLRQDHAAARHLRISRSVRRRDPHWRPVDDRHRPQQAPDRADLPEPGAVPADDGGGEHRLRPARARRRPRRARSQGGRAAAIGRLAGPGPQARFRAVRRPEAARGDRTRAGGRAPGAAARRTAVGARPQAAPAHAQRAARDPAAGRHHLHLHHARSGRGADHERPRRGDERRRDRAGRRGPQRLRQSRAPASSPPSLARTTASRAR